MRGPLIVIVAAVLAGVLLFLFTREGDDDASSTDIGIIDDETYVADDGAMLVGDPNKRPPRETPPREAPAPTAPPAETAAVLVAGVVLDADSGDPIPGAYLSVEHARSPCPRPARISLPPEGSIPEGFGNPNNALMTHGRTDAQGRFRILESDRDKHTGAVDLFVLAPGHIAHCACSVQPGSDLTIRLQPGASITGTVRDHVGRAVAGATVRVRPPPPAMPLPGNTTETLSTEEGTFKLDGLTREDLIIEVDHPLYMPYESEVLAPGAQSPHAVSLIPAYSIRFKIETNDGQEAKNPTLEWSAGAGTLQAAQGLQLLQPTALADSNSVNVKFKYRPVRIPANAHRVDLRLRADGYKAWEVKGEPIPPEGGRHTFPVLLERDDSQGTLRIALVDQEGNAISFAESGGRLAGITWLGAPEDRPTAFVMQATENLTFPGIQAGRYRIGLSFVKYGPVTLEVEVPAGDALDETATLGPPAQVRVRFRHTGAGKVTVQFIVKKDGRQVNARPVDESVREVEATEPGGAPSLHAAPSAGGLLVTGLGEGRHTIEVTSADLVSTPGSVDLVLGEVREIELDVTKR